MGDNAKDNSQRHLEADRLLGIIMVLALTALPAWTLKQVHDLSIRVELNTEKISVAEKELERRGPRIHELEKKSWQREAKNGR